MLFISVIPSFVSAQQVNTLYFMDNVPIRHNLNPAFQPSTFYYFSLPYIGLEQINLGNNSLTLKDVIYNYNGQTVSFLHPEGGNIQQFYNNLKSTTSVHADYETSLLSFGFKHKSAYWSFSLNNKKHAMIGIPRDFFLIALFGTPEIDNNSFDFTTLQADVTYYTEAALGYAEKLNNKWSVGGKLKFLYGTANASVNNKKLSLEAGLAQWTLKGNGSANVSGPFQIDLGDNFQSFTYKAPASQSDWLKPSGLGAGFDLGITFNPIKRLTFSAAITDLGFIRWKKNSQNLNYKIDYSFDGIGQIDSIRNFNSVSTVFERISVGNALADSLLNAFQTAAEVNKSYNSYMTGTPTKLNLGAEYSIMENRLSFGLLSRTIIFKKTVTQEITASVNAKPTDWMNTTLSYSVFGGRFSSVGAGIGLRTGFIHWFAAADYIPFQKSSLKLKEINANNPDIKIPIPYNTKSFNLSLGLNLVLDQLIPVNGLQLRKKKQDCNCN